MTYEEYTEKFNQLVDAYERTDDGFIKSDIKNEMISLQKSYMRGSNHESLNYKNRQCHFLQSP